MLFASQAGTCWVVLNIYPLEQSLRKLANMFGTVSSNKDNIMVFIAMLKSLRFTFDHGELVSDFSVLLLECKHYLIDFMCKKSGLKFITDQSFVVLFIFGWFVCQSPLRKRRCRSSAVTIRKRTYSPVFTSTTSKTSYRMPLKENPASCASPHHASISS